MGRAILTESSKRRRISEPRTSFRSDCLPRIRRMRIRPPDQCFPGYAAIRVNCLVRRTGRASDRAWSSTDPFHSPRARRRPCRLAEPSMTQLHWKPAEPDSRAKKHDWIKIYRTGSGFPIRRYRVVLLRVHLREPGLPGVPVRFAPFGHSSLVPMARCPQEQ